ncbi:MAG: hypothetical protein U9R79_14090, partial [Armatimonadota bacterium]|nr:hypothetical protein [Armatimonadota bacterium]
MRRCRDGALAVALLAGLQAVGAAVEAVEPTSEHRHVEEIASGHHEYDIVMGGTVDMDNSLTRSHGNIEVAFQPNISVTIENTGDVPVVNPRLVVNGRGNWYTLAGMVEEWTRGATTDQEKAYLIWENARHNRYHQSPLFRSVETFDPVKMFNVYGLNLCGQVGNAVTSLFLAAGLEGSYTRALHGHVQCEACVDGRHQFLDADQDCFYLDRENEAPISGDECARDADLVRRELNYGPLVEKWSYHGTAALFGPDDTEDSRPRPTGHEIAFTLRPGVRLVYRWDNVGKWAADREGVEPKYWGNSQFVYEPR